MDLTPALIGGVGAMLVTGAWTLVRSGELKTIREEGLRYWWWVDVVGYGIHSSGFRPKWHPTRYCSEEYCGYPPPGDGRRGDRTVDRTGDL